MGILDKIRRALDKHRVSELKKKIARLEPEAKTVEKEVSALKKKILLLEIDAIKQGKTVKSLTIVLNPRSGSHSNRFEFVLSDGTTNKPKETGKNSNRVAPVQELKPNPGLKPTLVGWSRDYDEKSVLVEGCGKAGVKVFGVVRKDGVKDILKVRLGKGSIPQFAIWWIESKEKVCKKCNVTATPPANGPLISLVVKSVKP